MSQSTDALDKTIDNITDALAENAELPLPKAAPTDRISLQQTAIIAAGRGITIDYHDMHLIEISLVSYGRDNITSGLTISEQGRTHE